MEAGVAVAGPRPSFRKPSHTSQRNYRRRSPSTSSRSTSSSPSPAHAPSGGWKRDRSASPSSPRRDGSRVNSVQMKKGKTAHKGDDSDEGSSQGRKEYGPGTSDRVVRGSSFDRHGKADHYDSRRPSATHSDRNQTNHSSRDSYGDARRNGDYDHSVRSRHSPDRGYRDRDRRTRDSERDGERTIKGKAGGREGNSEKDTEREGRLERDKNRDKDRDRSDRDRSRSRPGVRESFFDKELDLDRRNGGGRGSNRDRDKDRDRERENDRIKSRHTDKDADALEMDREKVREKDRGRDRYQGKTGGRDTDSPKDFDMEKGLGRERERDREREKHRDNPSGREVNMDKESDYERDGGRSRIRDGRDRDKTRTDEKAGRDFSLGDTDRDKDIGRGRDRGRGRDHESYGNRENSKAQERRREPERYSEDDHKDRKLKGKEDSRDGSRVQDRDEQKDRTRHRDKDEPRDLQKVKDEYIESRDRDPPRVKGEFSPPSDAFKVNQRRDKERTGSKVVKDEVTSPYDASIFNLDLDKEKTRGKTVSSSDLGLDKDEGGTSFRDKGQGSEREPVDESCDEEKGLRSSEQVNDEGSKKEKKQLFQRSETDGSSKFSSKDGEVKKDRGFGKGDSERAPEVNNMSAPLNDADKKVLATSDSKVSKGSKWGPEPTDSNAQGAVSEEVANDLSAAKLAALKAAELVNKNLGVPGFMSADQKKKLLWGGKKSAAEQEPTVAAGSNRWDTVHFSDPDRQEKFHKLMGVKADSGAEGKKEGDTDVGLFTEERQRELQQDLEKQFAAGLRRRDGRTVGLGL